MGRDPRKMTKDELQAVGHRPMSVIDALRLRCLDCCGGSPNEVRFCTTRKCPAWPFRMGENPWRKDRAPLSEEHKAKAAATLARAREQRRIVARE